MFSVLRYSYWQRDPTAGASSIKIQKRHESKRAQPLRSAAPGALNLSTSVSAIGHSYVDARPARSVWAQHPVVPAGNSSQHASGTRARARGIMLHGEAWEVSPHQGQQRGTCGQRARPRACRGHWERCAHGLWSEGSRQNTAEMRAA
eukprot:5773981-Prymnesium_polylepis.1